MYVLLEKKKSTVKNISCENIKKKKKSHDKNIQRFITLYIQQNLRCFETELFSTFYIFRYKMEEDINNPWSVENIEVFHLYCCPECEQKYSSNKIRKTQNKHLNIHSLSKFEQSVIVNLMPIS